MSRNNVRGPTSALTEFLRESGITATSIARRANQAAPGPSNLRNETEIEEQVGSSADRRANEGEYDSGNLDEDEVETSPAKKRKIASKGKGREKVEKVKAKAKAKAKKEKKAGDNEDDEDDSEEDEYTALSRRADMNRVASATAGAKPPVGSFEKCVKCEKQFTVTKYTIAADPGPGWLCHVCAKASGADPFKKPTAPRKRKAPEKKRRVVSYEEQTFPSLASLCIDVVSLHIDDVEALGDIGAVNRTEIGRVLSRNRQLTIDNAPILYDVRNTNLTFYDATKLGPNAFCTLASLNPNLESLKIDFCGRINNAAVKFWSEHLPLLKRLELLGPFLVRSEGWQIFFAGCPQLTGFLITQSPRFDLDCMISLVNHCPDLSDLRLSQIGEMDDSFLPHIANFKELTSLDLSEPGTSLTTEAVVDMLSVLGSRLTHLNLSKNPKLTNEMLSEGLTPNARILTTLILEELPEIKDAAVAGFFTDTGNPPLGRISLRRNQSLTDDSLSALLKHSGVALTDLDINNWKEVSSDALSAIGEHCKVLTKVDIGFCREVNDFVIKSIIEGCEKIQDISVFGCNHLTDSCPKKYGVSMRGIETHAV